MRGDGTRGPRARLVRAERDARIAVCGRDGASREVARNQPDAMRAQVIAVPGGVELTARIRFNTVEGVR